MTTKQAITAVIPMPNQAAFEKIARKELGIETLAERKSDRLDFHDVSVWGVQAALKAAYELGLADARAEVAAK